MNISSDKKQRSINAIKALCSRIASMETLTQDLNSQFMKSFAEEIDGFFDKAMADAYHSMKNMLYEVWQYREWETMSSEQAFLYGQLYGCVRLCEYRKENHQEIKWIDILASKYENSSLLSLIKRTPGIRHKDLAQKMEISPGALSQRMDDEDLNELLASRAFGREKYYFLSPRGELVWQEIVERKKQAEAEEIKKAHRENILKKPPQIDNDMISDDRARVIARDLSINFEVSFAQMQSFIESYVAINTISADDYLSVNQNGGSKKECLTEENSYRDQVINHLRHGSMMSSVG